MRVVDAVDFLEFELGREAEVDQRKLVLALLAVRLHNRVVLGPGPDADVVRLNVAVHETSAVQFLQWVQKLPHHVKHEPRRRLLRLADVVALFEEVSEGVPAKLHLDLCKLLVVCKAYQLWHRVPSVFLSLLLADAFCNK
jgi:hypothetical protein